MKVGQLLNDYFVYRNNKKYYSEPEQKTILNSFKKRIAKGMDDYLSAIDNINEKS